MTTWSAPSIYVGYAQVSTFLCVIFQSIQWRLSAHFPFYAPLVIPFRIVSVKFVASCKVLITYQLSILVDDSEVFQQNCFCFVLHCVVSDAFYVLDSLGVFCSSSFLMLRFFAIVLLIISNICRRRERLRRGQYTQHSLIFDFKLMFLSLQIMLR